MVCVCVSACIWPNKIVAWCTILILRVISPPIFRAVKDVILIFRYTNISECMCTPVCKQTQLNNMNQPTCLIVHTLNPRYCIITWKCEALMCNLSLLYLCHCHSNQKVSAWASFCLRLPSSRNQCHQICLKTRRAGAGVWWCACRCTCMGACKFLSTIPSHSMEGERVKEWKRRVQDVAAARWSQHEALKLRNL